VSLQPKTLALMDALTGLGFRPRALCQVLEIKDEGWRNAAEALLGRDRETVLVDPEHAEAAISLLRKDRDRFLGCRVANTRRLAVERDTAEPGTLASIIGSADRLAMAFVVFRLGTIRLAETQSDLMGHGRSVMRDGTYNDGIVIEIRRPDTLKIGRVAAQMMADVLAGDLRSEREIVATHQRNERFFADIHQRLLVISAPVPDTEKLTNLTIGLAEVDDRLATLKGRLERVGLLVDPVLREAMDKTRDYIASLRDDKNAQFGIAGGLRKDVLLLETRLGGGGLGSRIYFRDRWRSFRERVPRLLLFGALREAYAKRIGERSDSKFSSHLQDRQKELAAQRLEVDARIRDAVITYVLSFGGERPFDREPSVVHLIKPWLLESIALLEGNELIAFRRQADEAAERIAFLFRSSFIHELNNRFRALETEIDDLRTALRAKRLHGEIYSLHGNVKPEFRDLHDLARASETDDAILGALFNPAAEIEPRYAAAVAEVERLLRDPEFPFQVYQDYRNYYTFELRMRALDGHETSYDRRRGVASGAERQVPFYVIIGAALSSIYHGAKKATEGVKRGIGLAVFDEAFSKMDGPNQRTMLDFYDEIGLQVMIAAPTEKRAIVYENLDSIIDVYKFDNRQCEAEVSIIKKLARQSLHAANPDHLSDDDLRAQLVEPNPVDQSAEAPK
jgi:hypothetical protein